MLRLHILPYLKVNQILHHSGRMYSAILNTMFNRKKFFLSFRFHITKYFYLGQYVSTIYLNFRYFYQIFWHTFMRNAIERSFVISEYGCENVVFVVILYGELIILDDQKIVRVMFH